MKSTDVRCDRPGCQVCRDYFANRITRDGWIAYCGGPDTEDD